MHLLLQKLPAESLHLLDKLAEAGDALGIPSEAFADSEDQEVVVLKSFLYSCLSFCERKQFMLFCVVFSFFSRNLSATSVMR